MKLKPTYFEIWQKINVMSVPGIEKSHKVLSILSSNNKMAEWIRSVGYLSQYMYISSLHCNLFRNLTLYFMWKGSAIQRLGRAWESEIEFQSLENISVNCKSISCTIPLINLFNFHSLLEWKSKHLETDIISTFRDNHNLSSDTTRITFSDPM